MFLLKEKKNEYTSISRGRQDSSYSRDRESYRERERESVRSQEYTALLARQREFDERCRQVHRLATHLVVQGLPAPDAVMHL